ncbi:hypothetical protein HNR42_001219 [Deinobacterium chartae]|uniref:Uncharacterized protein n=1 Tax=Deinobacterium chartae TaxID=521158 RepID=A0A841HY25_9DEIO|nr:hypothetical protein [Deinobacterium chartae]MBB6097796.1 hypothetical protein [Deinobacterium chartae]
MAYGISLESSGEFGTVKDSEHPDLPVGARVQVIANVAPGSGPEPQGGPDLDGPILELEGRRFRIGRPAYSTLEDGGVYLSFDRMAPL